MNEASKPANQMALSLRPEDARAAAPTCCATRDETLQRLEAVSDGAFFAKLLTELTRRLQWQFSAGREVHELVTLAMAMDGPESIRNMLYGVRRAMGQIVRGGPVASQELAAAAGLHYVGFRQLVQRNRIAPAHGEYLLALMGVDSVQNPAHQAPQLIIGAIVVSAVFGGRVEFDAGGLTRSPSHMRRIVTPENADGSENAIDRALFAAWFPTDARTPHIADGTLEMTSGDYSRLKARIGELREVDEVAVGVWVSSGERHQAIFSAVGKKLKIPILLETSVAVEEALGMPPSDFLAQMGEYWARDTDLRQPVAGALVAVASESVIQSPPGDKSVTHITIGTINNAGPTQTVIGDQASLSMQIAHNSLDAAALAPLLATLAAAISALNDPDAKAAYQAHLKTLADESKAPKPDKSKMSRALEMLKNAPDYLKGGKAMADAAVSIYNWTLPFINSNPILSA